MSRDLKKIIEALLFVSETPLSLAQLGQVLEDSQRDAIKQALEELQEEYKQSERAMEVAQVAGGWVFRTRKEMAFWLRKLKKQQVTRLSKAALETLSVVAYKQPVLKAEIERIRGVEVGGILRTLMEKNLVRVAGRQDLPGRPLIYCTTRRFLEVFDLQDLKDLPTLEELEKLAGISQDTPADQEEGLPLGAPPAPTLDDLIPVEGGLPPLKEAEDNGEYGEWDAPPDQDGEATEGEATEGETAGSEASEDKPQEESQAPEAEEPATEATDLEQKEPQEEPSVPESTSEATTEPIPEPAPEPEPVVEPETEAVPDPEPVDEAVPSPEPEAEPQPAQEPTEAPPKTEPEQG